MLIILFYSRADRSLHDRSGLGFEENKLSLDMMQWVNLMQTRQGDPLFSVVKIVYPQCYAIEVENNLQRPQTHSLRYNSEEMFSLGNTNKEGIRL